MSEAASSLGARHQEHYRTCNCLADSGVCCVPTCACHDDPARTEATMAEHIVIADMTIQEFTNGREVSCTTLRRQGHGSPLAIAERVLTALEALALITDEGERSEVRP